ncbi:MAG: hypothetical protein IJV48_06800 [Ruminococcus sp.]|nr:hypothetical protein [Ruminococcus sp.]
MLCRKKLSPVRRKLRKYTAILLVIVIGCVTYFEYAVKAQLKDIIVRDMQTVAEQAVTAAVDEFLAEHTDIGEKLCDISYNNGTVAAVTTNTPYVNYIKTSVTESAQEQIDYLSHHQGVSARLGSFTGLVLLMNVGPQVYFSVDSTQTVSCEFESSFESGGLNQTVHHVTMTVYVDLLIYNPFRIAETVSTSSTFEIAQTVIVGSVPSYGGVISY